MFWKSIPIIENAHKMVLKVQKTFVKVKFRDAIFSVVFSQKLLLVLK